MAGKIRNFYGIVEAADELVGLAHKTFRDYFCNLARGNDNPDKLNLAQLYLFSASSLIMPIEGRRPKDEAKRLDDLRQGIQKGLESISQYK